MKTIKKMLRYVRLFGLPRTLFYRFILIILLPLVILQISALTFFYTRHWDTLSRRLATNITGEIQFIIDTLENNDLTQEQQAAFLKDVKDNLELTVVLAPDGVLAENSTQDILRTAHGLKKMLSEMKLPFVMNHIDSRTQQIQIQLSKGILIVEVPRKRFFSSTVDVFLVWMIGSALLIFGIAFLFMKNQVRSIERLAKAAKQFGLGDLFVRFKPEGATEVRQAGKSFLQMQERIQRSITERTALLAGVSHDLRTPLTRMKLQLSLMEQTDQTEELQEEILQMQQMISAYLDFARENQKEPLTSVNLRELVQKETRKIAHMKYDIFVDQLPEVFVLARPVELTRAIRNILSNAQRYATKTWVRLKSDKQEVRLIVEDNGKGIPARERENVFRPFYRVEKSRNPETGGVGLGLTVTRDIVISHGGEIMLEDSPHGGLRVVVQLPKEGKPADD